MQNKTQENHFFHFSKIKRDKVLKEKLFIESCKKQMFEDLELKEYFIKEPRIINLSYNDNFDIIENRKRKVLSEAHNDEYTITFSDNSTLSFEDLKFESLKEVKKKFLEKMEELAPEHSNTPI